jgi:transposase
MGRPTKYPEQFRRNAVELVESSKRPIAEVARSLSINEGTLWNWVRDARQKLAGDVDPELVRSDSASTLRRLRKEVIELRTDKEILRRAAASFARGTTR